jgi:hypothetical protein
MFSPIAIKELQALGVMATLYRKVYPERRRTTWKWKNKKENQQLAYRLSLSFLTERPAGPTLDAVIPVLPRASNPQLKITHVALPRLELFASSFPGHGWCRNSIMIVGVRGPVAAKMRMDGKNTLELFLDLNSRSFRAPGANPFWLAVACEFQFMLADGSQDIWESYGICSHWLPC